MSTDLDLELVRELRAEPTEPSAATRERARSALAACIDAEVAVGAPLAPTPVRRGRGRGARRRRLLLPSLGLAAAAGATTLVLVLGLGSGGAAAPDKAAAAVLERAARAAGAAGGPRAMRAGEYWYVRSRSAATSTTVYGNDRFYTTVTPQLREIWIGRDGGGRVRSVPTGRTVFASPRDRAAWVSAGRPKLGYGLDTPLTNDDAPAGRQNVIADLGGPLTYRGLLALPTNVDALTRRVQAAAAGAGPSPREEMFTIIGDLLRETPAPAALRAALYRVAERIPGIELVGHTRDGLGRPALAVALTARGTRHELLFDPRTAHLLAERDVSLHNAPGSKLGLPPGFVTDEATYIDSGIVQRIGQRP